jgi:hypothetical protein
MVRNCIVILMLLFFMGCVGSMPKAGKSIETGDEVKAPRGYIEMKKREEL